MDLTRLQVVLLVRAVECMAEVKTAGADSSRISGCCHPLRNRCISDGRGLVRGHTPVWESKREVWVDRAIGK